MKRTTQTEFAIYVLRGGSMIAYSAATLPTIEAAREEASRFIDGTPLRPAEPYVEIRQIETVRTVTCLERVEGAEA